MGYKEDLIKKIDEAHNFQTIKTDKVTLKLLNNLKDNEQLVIDHPNIKDLTITIKREVSVDTVCNMPVIFHSIYLTVEDTFDRVFPKHNLYLRNEDLNKYIKDLLNCKDRTAYNYCKRLKEENVELNDIIQFKDGKKGVISYPIGEYWSAGNLLYIPLKSDGTLSKHKPRMIYAGVEYKKVGTYK